MGTCVRREVAHPAYLREKARELRTKKKLSLIEIAERLALPKTTVFYWIKDLPDPEIKFCDSPVFSVRAHDTMLRSRLQAWMDQTQDRWLDSAVTGCSAAW